MMIRLFAVLALGMASDVTGQEHSRWVCTKWENPMSAKLFDVFTLQGSYLTPGSCGPVPYITVNCVAGKFEAAQLNVGTEVAPSVLDRSFARVDLRFGEKKPATAVWDISNDGEGLYFGKTSLIQLLTGEKRSHPGKKDTLGRRVRIAVTNISSTVIVMQFDMPQDLMQLVQACDLEKGRK